jgi:replication factor A1
VFLRDLDLRKISTYNNDITNSGRPRGRKSKSSQDVLYSIALIAAKYGLDQTLLLDAFNRAWINEESQCDELKIKSNKADENTAIIQIIFNDEIVWQYPINIDILERPELYKSGIPLIHTPIHRRDDSGKKHIGELRAKMRRVSVTARVLEVPPKVLVRTRYGGESFVSNILLADETGTALLSLWNSQINDVAVGDTVKIENATVVKYQDGLQLRMGRTGTMTVDRSTKEEPQR